MLWFKMKRGDILEENYEIMADHIRQNHSKLRKLCIIQKIRAGYNNNYQNTL